MKYRCAHCGKVNDKAAGCVNRARRAGLKLFCNRTCSGLARRSGKTDAQKREEKRLYDIVYQAENREKRCAQKREYHKRTYEPEAAAEYRKTRMPYHVEYCRQPEYRAKKSVYDRKRRAAEYGDFAEAFQLTIDLNREIKGRMTNEQITQANGTQNKTQRRRRASAEEPQRSRARNRFRRRTSDQAAHGG